VPPWPWGLYRFNQVQPSRAGLMVEDRWRATPGPQVWGLGVGPTTPPRKKIIVTHSQTRKKRWSAGQPSHSAGLPVWPINRQAKAGLRCFFSAGKRTFAVHCVQSHSSPLKPSKSMQWHLGVILISGDGKSDSRLGALHLQYWLNRQVAPLRVFTKILLWAELVL